MTELVEPDLIESTEDAEDSVSGQKETIQVMEMVLQKVVGSGPNLTEKQIDKIIDQRDKVIDYTKQDNDRESYDQKYNLTMFILFFLLIFILILWRSPEYLGEVISAILGCLGGYGYGKTKS